jgi:hypothetical protein
MDDALEATPHAVSWLLIDSMGGRGGQQELRLEAAASVPGSLRPGSRRHQLERSRLVDTHDVGTCAAGDMSSTTSTNVSGSLSRTSITRSASGCCFLWGRTALLRISRSASGPQRRRSRLAPLRRASLLCMAGLRSV